MGLVQGTKIKVLESYLRLCPHMVSTLPDCREDKNYINNPEYKNKLQINHECSQRVSCSELTEGMRTAFWRKSPQEGAVGALVILP